MRVLIITIAMLIIISCEGKSGQIKDQPIQGKLFGENWIGVNVATQEYDFGSRKETKTSIYAEQCEEFECLAVKSPSLNIANLDLSQSGELSLTNNITIFTPPDKNITITTGNYMVSRFEGKIKLEIQFYDDENNQLTGHILF